MRQGQAPTLGSMARIDVCETGYLRVEKKPLGGTKDICRLCPASPTTFSKHKALERSAPKCRHSRRGRSSWPSFFKPRCPEGVQEVSRQMASNLKAGQQIRNPLGITRVQGHGASASANTRRVKGEFAGGSPDSWADRGHRWQKPQGATSP